MSKVYAVYHCYEEEFFDGEMSVEKEDLICCFDSREKAEEFKKKYECPHLTHKFCGVGNLEIREFPTTYNEKDFWWIIKG